MDSDAALVVQAEAVVDAALRLCGKPLWPWVPAEERKKLLLDALPLMDVAVAVDTPVDSGGEGDGGDRGGQVGKELPRAGGRAWKELKPFVPCSVSGGTDPGVSEGFLGGVRGREVCGGTGSLSLPERALCVLG